MPIQGAGEYQEIAQGIDQQTARKAGPPLRVGIINVTGYSGSELARLLHRHPKAKITSVTGRSAAGQELGEVFPHLSDLDMVIQPELDGSFDLVLLRTAPQGQRRGGHPTGEGRHKGGGHQWRLPSSERFRVRRMVRRGPSGAPVPGGGRLRADRVEQDRSGPSQPGCEPRMLSHQCHLGHGPRCKGRADRAGTSSWTANRGSQAPAVASV